AVDRASQLLVIVYLDKRRESQLPRPSLQAHEILLLECRDDQQRRISADRSRLEQLILVNDEVLAEERKRDCLTHCGEMFQRTIEKGGLGEHGDRRGATCFVLPGDGNGVVL